MKKFEMTKAEMFAEVIAMATEAGRADIAEWAEYEREMVSRKRVSTKKIEEQARLDEMVFDAMTEAKASEMTCTELVELVGSEDIKSTSKMSAILKRLAERGAVIREVQGKKAVFSIA